MRLAHPKSTIKVRSFYGLAAFYQRFISNFTSLVAPMTDCLKKKGFFVWTEEIERAFIFIKEKITNTLVIAFSNFEKMFDLKCDACGVGIEAVLSQEKRPIAFS